MSSIARNAKFVHAIGMGNRIATLESIVQSLAPKSWLMGILLTIGLGFFGVYFSMSSNIDGRLSQTDQRIARVEQRIDRVEQKMDRFEQRIDRLEQRMERIEDQLIQIRQILLERPNR